MKRRNSLVAFFLDGRAKLSFARHDELFYRKRSQHQKVYLALANNTFRRVGQSTLSF
jgi:hypothetical protein